MAKTRIVTDSAAELGPAVVEALGISVVPWHIRLGTETVVDGPSLRTVEAYRRMARQKVTPVAIAPTRQQFVAEFSELAKSCDEIVAVVSSPTFGRVLNEANRARAGVLGRCQIRVVDSQFISRPQGDLVALAGQAAMGGADGAEVARLVMGAIPSTYLAFHVEVLDYMVRTGLITREAEIPGGLSWSLLMVEDGHVAYLRRSRRRGTPVERLFEFISEFEQADHLSIVHTGLSSGGEELGKMLQEQAPDLAYTEHIYGPVLSSLIGPVGFGVAVVDR